MEAAAKATLAVGGVVLNVVGDLSPVDAGLLVDFQTSILFFLLLLSGSH